MPPCSSHGFVVGDKSNGEMPAAGDSSKSTLPENGVDMLGQVSQRGD